MNSQVNGFEAVTLQNERLKVSILPSIGGKIHEFVDLATDRDLLFHHPRVEVRLPVFGANVDNWWSGGIDDCVPTGHPCVVNGEELPFLGEVWSLPWTVENRSASSVTLSRTGVITPLLLRKTVALEPGSDSMVIEYELSNIGLEPFDYLWGIHPAFPLGKNTRIVVPAATVRYGDGKDTSNTLSKTFMSGAETAAWPLTAISEFGPDASMSWHHAYLSDLSEGTFAVIDEADGSGVEVTFPHDVFPYVHVWVVDGGWRSIRVAVVEPWTGAPARLDQAIEQGSANSLTPGNSVSAQLKFRAL